MRRTPALAVLVAIGLSGALAAGTRATEVADLKLLDLQFRLLRSWAPVAAAREVVVVGIDEETVTQFREPMTLWHRHLGRFFTAMAQARPAAVGIDIVLPDRSYEAVVPGSDRELMKGLIAARKSYPLVLALTVDQAGKPRAIHPPFVTLAAAGGPGYALFPVDGDGAVRRFDERLAGADAPVPTLVGQMARQLGTEPRPGYLNYRQGAPFDYVPLQQVLHWAEAGDSAALERAFAGKPVLLGTLLPYLDDLAVPVRLAAWDAEGRRTPGVLVQAQALRNLVNGGLVDRAPAAAGAALAAAAALLWLVSAATAAVVALTIGLAVMLLAGSTWLLAQGLFVPVLAPALTAVAALGGRHGYDTFHKLAERRRLRASFSGYVSPAVMDEILAGRIQPELGGVTQFVCVVFSDIRGYTTRSERMGPEEVIAFLNRYFERVVALVHERDGSVVSFMGDGIMAVFGAPKPLANPCREAFGAARGMLAFVADLNRDLVAEGDAPMEIGIGLHAGEAVVGHVGSSTRHDFTVIGDVTNVASRLETLTKETGYRVVISSAAVGMLGEVAGLVALGPMAIKGHTPVEVYGYDRGA
jgi:class 3 adenylate cyclase/CHASE2 domain-containing sensor protein